ncbi:MAG: hypothetical protein M3540_12530 [Actinomycetota bacterium]|nr:hypothetical protein [Actinomycetota bacterium]
MTSRRLLLAAGISLAVAAAAFLAVLALDVLRWRGELERADVRSRVAIAQPGLWTIDTTLPSGLSEGALGLEDDIAFRRALQRFRLGRPTETPRNQQQLAVRAQASVQLARVVRTDSDAERRSRAATLRGILTFEEARGDPAHAGARLRESLGQFREAILLDPGNEIAKFDLELALRQLQSTEEEAQGRARRPAPRGQSQGSGAGASSNQTGF